LRRLVVLGAGEFARQVIRLVEDANRDAPVYQLLGFLDDGRGAVDPELQVIGTDERLSSLHADYVIGVGSPGLRRKLGTFAHEHGRRAASLIHSASFVDRRADMGDGALIAECAHVQYGATVGRHAIVNVNSVVGHDCTIGDYAAIAGNVMVGARTMIGDDVMFGMGSVVLGDVKVGDRAVIGAGAVVTRDVPADTCVVGVPARVLISTR
jgi:sugar O-acyltransferase (sialic acid O-acetyltransferase NeuD family)